MKANIVQPGRRDRHGELGDAVHEGFRADIADLGMAARLMQQVLATAEADLQPEQRQRPGKQRGQRSGADLFQRDGEARQIAFHMGDLRGAQLLALAPPVKGGVANGGKVIVGGSGHRHGNAVGEKQRGGLGVRPAYSRSIDRAIGPELSSPPP